MADAVFAVESFESLMPELPPLLHEHWLEVALNQDKIKLNPDFLAYVRMEKAGMLAVQTVRKDAALVGYFISMVVPHMHYRDSLTAYTDIYFIRRGHRNAFTSLRFFRFVADDLKARGVQRQFVQVKLHTDPTIAKMWERLGYRPIETWFSKMLEP